MDDCISRGDAIKAVLVSNFSACTVFGRSEEGMATAKELIQVIKNLPSHSPRLSDARIADGGINTAIMIMAIVWRRNMVIGLNIGI